MAGGGVTMQINRAILLQHSVYLHDALAHEMQIGGLAFGMDALCQIAQAVKIMHIGDLIMAGSVPPVVKFAPVFACIERRV